MHRRPFYPWTVASRRRSCSSSSSSSSRRARKWTCPQPTRLFSLAAGKSGCSGDPKVFDAQQQQQQQQHLESLQKRLEKLNGGPLNVQSTMQVSRAIFGDIQSVSNDKLIKAVDTLPAGSREQQLAKIVLEVKQLLQAMKLNTNQPDEEQSSRDFISERSFSPPGVNNDDPNDDTEIHKTSTTNNTNQFVSLDGDPPEFWEIWFDDNDIPPHAKHVLELFDNERCQLHISWKKPLMDLTRPAAQALVFQLDPKDCPIAYDPYYKIQKPKNPQRSFLNECQDIKKRHPETIVLARCGDFYETFGMDAIMMVEHAGLNPMGDRARAGCPKNNVQTTLDRLTEQGFSVAVYEESGASGGKQKLKHRFVAQIVTPASPFYKFGWNMKDETPEDNWYSRPYTGVLKFASGYTLVEISVEDQVVRVLEQLTAQAVAAHLAAHPPVEPVLYVPSQVDYKSGKRITTSGSPFLSARIESEGGRRGTHHLQVKSLNPTLMTDLGKGQTDAKRCMSVILTEVLKDQTYRDGENACPLKVTDFVLLQQSSGATTRTNPLNSETAKQLGLLGDEKIPLLLPHVLPSQAPAGTKQLAKRWLMTPPPLEVTQAFAELVHFLQQPDARGFPHKMETSPIARWRTLLRAGQANSYVYAEIYRTLAKACKVLDCLQNRSHILEAFITVLQYEAGLSFSHLPSFRNECQSAADLIQSVIDLCVLGIPGSQPDESSDGVWGEKPIPREFWQRNENTWRRRIQRSAALESYERVEDAAKELVQAIETDFAGLTVLDDAQKNFLSVKFSAKELKEKKYEGFDKIHHANKIRYDTEQVRDAQDKYLRLCEKAREKVESVLASLNSELYGKEHVPTIVLAAHTNMIFATAWLHALHARRHGWNRAMLIDSKQAIGNGNDSGATGVRLSFKNVWPYWMLKQEAAHNDIEMEGMWVLTAPNMGGKSTLMRSTAAAALLSICGFCAPLGPGSSLDCLDNIFVRGASADIPSEGKSAFAGEMSDVQSLITYGGRRSLVFVDELGRGTSPVEGTALAAAILEFFAANGMTGIFATHLHGILDLGISPKAKDRISTKRMNIAGAKTYKLEDGECRDSMALATASDFGIPAPILCRASSFMEILSRKSHSAAPIHGGHPSPSTRTDDPTQTILLLAREVTENDSIITIEPESAAPIWLQGQSCLYILEIPSVETNGDAINRYYIGETDDIHNRLCRHRATFNPSLRSLIIVASDKTKARHWETLLIRASARAGIDLVSKADGYHSVRPLS